MATFYPLNKFVDSRGWSLNDIYSFCEVPEKAQINYSILYPGIVKAWHRHKYQDDYFCVVKGMAKVGVVMDDYPHKGLYEVDQFYIGEHNPGVVHIKAGEWHGLTAVGTEPVGLLYLVTNRYNPEEPDEERCPHHNFVGSMWWLPEHK